MDKDKLVQLFEEIKREGISAELEEKIRREIEFNRSHYLEQNNPRYINPESFGDLYFFQGFRPRMPDYATCLQTLDDLLERDEQRVKDGFPRKIRVGKIARPGPSGNVVVVPATTEDKLIHEHGTDEEEQETGGAGAGGEGEVIGESPLGGESGSGTGAGSGSDGEHDIESGAYDLGKILTERFQLPNLEDKGKKKALKKEKYDLTDWKRKSGSLLDKKRTMREILETNIALGIIDDPKNIDLSKLLVDPNDLIYRVPSLEVTYESQALVFFIRDYSGSMHGDPTDTVVTTHILTHAWLTYQYKRLVEERFILHDTSAKEVIDFNTYCNLTVSGGTRVASAFELLNKIVDENDLARDYNIYVFYGSDGEDWDSSGKNTLPHIERTLSYVNRLGMTIARNRWSGAKETEIEKYIKESGFLEKYPDKLRLDAMDAGASQERLIEGIKHIISPGVIR